MFGMNKENKFSAYWVLYAIKENMGRSVLFTFSIILLGILVLLTITKMDIFSILSVIMLLYIVFITLYAFNMVGVLAGNQDLREFHNEQDNVYFIVGFTDEDEIMLSAFVSGFEAKVLYIMKENGWLHIHDKTIVKLDVYNSKDLQENDAEDFYSERENLVAHNIVYHALLSKEYGEHIKEQVKYCTVAPPSKEDAIEEDSIEE